MAILEMIVGILEGAGVNVNVDIVEAVKTFIAKVEGLFKKGNE